MKKMTCSWLGLSLILPFLLVTPVIWAADLPEISTLDLKNKLESKEGVFLFNSESDIEYNLEHIPGAVNIPSREISTTNKLPQDKETPIVVY